VDDNDFNLQMLEHYFKELHINTDVIRHIKEHPNERVPKNII
jgi:hypothetical protein